MLRQSIPARADKTYLKVLQLAKLHSEQEVAEALELLLEEHQLPTSDAVKSLMDAYRQARSEAQVYQPNVADYDSLLSTTYLQETH